MLLSSYNGSVRRHKKEKATRTKDKKAVTSHRGIGAAEASLSTSHVTLEACPSIRIGLTLGQWVILFHF